MKAYVTFLAACILTVSLPAVGGGLLKGPSAAPCDSVASSPFVGEMLIFDVSIEGGGTTALVAANDSFTVTFDYYVQVCDTPTTHNYVQGVAGFAAAGAPALCFVRERVDCGGTTGTASFKLKAPAFPSEYLIAFDYQRTLTEPPCPSSWPFGAPTHDQYIGCVTVTAGSLPVPVTGSVSNVTTTSATLHGTVNPQGFSTAARFIYGTASGSYTDSVTAFESPVNGSSAVAVSASAAGLTANTRYYYRATAESENGYNVGAEQSFFTGPLFSLPDPVHDFGYLEPDGLRTDSVAVTNIGNVTLQITSIVPLAGQYSVSPGSASVLPGATRKFAVTFAPPAYGRYNSGIVFIHGGTSSPDTLAVRGGVPIGGVLAGWNIVSVPLTVPDPRKTQVFPEAVSNAFEFSAGYFVRDTVVNGRGYWLKFPATDSLVVTGDVRSTETVPVADGWNMVGGPSLPVPIDSVASAPPNLLAGNFFEYAGGYAPVTTLLPGKGYWIKANGPGTLTLKGQAGSIAPAAGVLRPSGSVELTVSDARGRIQRLYVGSVGSVGSDGSDGSVASAGGRTQSAEMPPAPPPGAFDVRFDGDLLVAAPGPSGAYLRIRNAVYPVAITWNGGEGNGRIAAGGTEAPLDRAGSLVISGGEAETPVLVTGPGTDMDVPSGSVSAWGLTGSYPNPFNPSTVIVFALQAAGDVRLAVYNTLGEEVALLADGERAAGEHRAVFDGANLPGGVYFCRLQTLGGMTAIKIALVK